MKLPDFITQAFNPILESLASPPPAGEPSKNNVLQEKDIFGDCWPDQWFQGETAHALPPGLDPDFSFVPPTSTLPVAVPASIWSGSTLHAGASSNTPQPTQPIAPSMNAVASSGASGAAQAPPATNTQLYDPSLVAPLTDTTDPFLQFDPAQPSPSSSENVTIPLGRANAYPQPYLGTGNASELRTRWNDMSFDTAGMGTSQIASQSTFDGFMNTMNTQTSNFYLPASQTGNGNGLGNLPTTQSLAPSSSLAGGWGVQSAQAQQLPVSQEQQQRWLMLQRQNQQRQQQFVMLQWQGQQGNAGWVPNLYQGQDQNAPGFENWNANTNTGQHLGSYIPNHYPSSSIQMPRPPQRVMGPYPAMQPAQHSTAPRAASSSSHSSRRPSNPQLPQRVQPVATQPATMQMVANRTTAHRSAQLAQGSNPGTGEAVITPGTALLQRVFAPPSGGAVGPTGQAQAQSSRPLKFGFVGGKKRAREDEDEGEEDDGRPKKKSGKARDQPSKPKEMPRVIAIQHNSQVLPRQQGEVGAGPVLQQHAEDKSCLSTPELRRTITGASQQASAPPEKLSTSMLFVQKPDFADPAFSKLLTKPVTLKGLSVIVPPLVPCHWGYDGTKPPCGYVCKDRAGWYGHMWSKAHEADLVHVKAQAECRWPGCTKWEKSKGAGSLAQGHMSHGFHSWVLTRFLRLKCHQCQAFVGGTLEHWSTRATSNQGLKPYNDHAEECHKRVGRKEDFLWEVCPAD